MRETNIDQVIKYSLADVAEYLDRNDVVLSSNDFNKRRKAQATTTGSTISFMP